MTRYSGVGLSYSLGVALFGGIAPLAFTWLIQLFHFVEAPAFYIMFCAAMTGYALRQNKSLLYNSRLGQSQMMHHQESLK